MKFKSIFRAFMLTAMCCGAGYAMVSCTEDAPGEGDISYGTGTLQGVVTDNENNLLAGVTVSIEDIEGNVQTNEDGSFTYPDVPIKTQLVSFTKDGYGSIGMTVNLSSFSEEGVATINPVMPIANAAITGTVLDARNGGQPFEGVTVTAGNRSTLTDSEGKFVLDKIASGDYSVTFSAAGVESITKSITEDMFVNLTANIEDPVYLGGDNLLGDMSAEELKDAETWYYNQYRGGKGNGGGVVDWSCVYMSTLTFVGQWENQNEGVTLQVRNGEADQTNPADLENFDSYMYGKKLITEDNYIMTLQARTHNAENGNDVRWGVRVIDITDMVNPTSNLITGVQEFSNTSYEQKTINLSEYIGKEVIIAVGIFRAKTGNYYNQFVMRTMSFAKEANVGDNYLPGTEVAGLSGWHMTNEMVRSTMTNPERSFTGISTGDVKPQEGVGYQPWNGTNHIADQWAFMYVNKDVEPTASEGFVIKVRSDASANTVTPESYFYAKFAIDANRDHLTFVTRNMDDNKATYFKMTAITEDGEVTHLQPVAHKATQAEAAADGCWKFINNAGDPGHADAYATFEYDLSGYTGENIVLAVGVFKGETTDGEQKLCINSINLD